MSRKAIMWALVVVGLAMVPQVSFAQIENLLNNPSFEVAEPIPGPSWNVWFPAEGEGSTATIDTRHSIDGSGSCRINAKGTAQWHFYVTQNNIAMEVGETYTLSFWAKAQSTRDMSVLMKGQNNDGPEWCNLNAELTTEWTEYHVSGECTQANAKLDMSFGKSEIPLWLDFVHLYKGEYVADIKPSERTEPEEPQPVASLVKNNNFEIDETIPGPSWATWNPAAGDGSTAAIDFSDSVDGSGSCRIDGQGSTNWDFYVINRGIPMEVGKTYTLSFWAKAAEPRSIMMLLKGNDNSGPAFCEITAELTTEWTEYTATGECTQPDCKLDIASGGPIPLWLDFVQLYEGEYVQIIPGGREEVVEASNPSPATGAYDTSHDATLTWAPGVTSVTHNVYLGTSLDDVNDAEGGSDLLVSAAQDANSYAASLDFATTYFWRIDGIDNAGEAIKGTVWSFTTSSFVGVDDMESYSNEEDSRIFNTWKDGYDNATENGALVGANPIANDYSPETLTVHSGDQSLPIHYANANGVLYSEAKRTFDMPEDWTADEVTTLAMNAYGWSVNTGSLYVKINDTKIPYTGAENALQNEYWTQMYVDLTALSADLLKEVTSMSIGVEGANALGKLYVDDIRLLRQVIEVPAAVANPVIDGQMDTVWEEVKAHPIDAQRNGSPVESDLDSSGTIQMLWDAENLYVLVDVNDEALVQDSANGWDDDRIEIFIDADGSKTASGPGTQGTDGINDYQYAFSWIPSTVSPLEWYFNGDARDALAGVDSAVILTDDGYQIEVKFPWSTLLGDVPSAGDFIGIALAVADDDDGGAGDSQVTALMAGTGSPHRPNLWGTAKLSE